MYQVLSSTSPSYNTVNECDWFAYGLGTVVHVVLVAQVVEVVVHVLRSVDLEELSLSVSDVEGVPARCADVLPQEGRNDGSVVLSVEGSEDGLVDEGGSEDGEQLVADGHALEAGDSEDSLDSEPGASEPCELSVSLQAIVESLQLFSVFDWDVVGQEVAGDALIAESVEVLEPIFFDVALLEPGTS